MRRIVIGLMAGVLIATISGQAIADAPLGNVGSKFDITLYGFTKLDASYDTHKTVAGNLAFFALPESDGSDDEFNMTANETRLGLKIAGPEVMGGNVSGCVEIDFYGGGEQNKANPRMRLAYVDYAMDSGLSFRAGQDWETFINVIPKSVNFAYLADQGALGLRRPQFRVSQDIALGSAKLTAKLAAARTIGKDMDGAGQDDGADSGAPSGQWNLLLQAPLWLEQSARFGISGHYGQETVDGVNTNGSVVKKDDKNYDTWSVIGSLFLPIVEQLAIQGTIWQGENLGGSYYGGIGQGINLAEDKGIGAKGGWIQAVINPMDKVNINLTYGVDDPDDGDLSKNNRSKNQIIGGNIFYSLDPSLILAFEYLNIETSYKDADNAKDNRFQASVIYKF
ncbi:MAG: hypothetical protein EOM20_05065 [Spartobacteria bacterium]|nr:hypothetical protein [Spartobacteria bacterium]